MKLQHLKYIVEIADCHSITKASKKLFVSQPYLSKVVAEAESRLKKQLFVRHSRGLELTPYGQKVYLLAQSVIRQMELLDNLENGEEQQKKLVKLSVSVANLILKESLFLDYFSLQNAERQEMECYETTIQGCIENIEKDVSEFAVIVIDDAQKRLLERIIEGKGLEYRELDEGYPYYHLHRDHPLADREKITASSLINYPFVSLKMDDFAVCSSERFREEYPQIHVNRSILVNHYHSYLSIVKHNDAFMLGNKWQISELEKMGIKSIRFSSKKMKLHLAILKKSKSILSPESEIFLRLMKESYGLNDA